MLDANYYYTLAKAYLHFARGWRQRGDTSNYVECMNDAYVARERARHASQKGGA